MSVLTIFFLKKPFLSRSTRSTCKSSINGKSWWSQKNVGCWARKRHFLIKFGLRSFSSTSSRLYCMSCICWKIWYIDLTAAAQGEDFGEVNMGDDQGRSKKRRRTGAPERSQEELLRQRAIAGMNCFKFHLLFLKLTSCRRVIGSAYARKLHLLPRWWQASKQTLNDIGWWEILSVFTSPWRTCPTTLLNRTSYGTYFTRSLKFIIVWWSFIQHAGACTAVEDDVYQEIADFQRALVRMFDMHDQAPIFFETSGTGKRVSRAGIIF